MGNRVNCPVTIMRGSTGPLVVSVPEVVDLSEVSEILITVGYADEFQVTKSTEDDEVMLDTENRLLTMFFTQAETLGFSGGHAVPVQVNFMYGDARVPSTQAMIIIGDNLLNREVTPNELP